MREINKKALLRLLSRTVGIIAVVILSLQILITFIPLMLGYDVFTIRSDDMSPKQSFGSLVIVSKVEFENIKIGDIAAFRSAKDKNRNFTHCIEEINTENQTFVTKALKNPLKDPEPIPYSQMTGVVELTIPFAGLISVFLSETIAKFAVFLVLVLWVAIELEIFRRQKAAVPNAKVPAPSEPETSDAESTGEPI